MASHSGVVVVLTGALLVAGCAAPASDPAARGGTTTATGSGAVSRRAGSTALRITTQLGEQCPHLPVTPDPRCDPVPRPNTGFDIRTTSGEPVARGRSGADGQATVQVEAGTYVVRGEPVAGYRLTPERRVTVSGTATVAVPLTYANGLQ